MGSAFTASNDFADLGNVAGKLGEAGVLYPGVATVAASIPSMVSALSIALACSPPVWLTWWCHRHRLVVHDFLGIDDPDEQGDQVLHFLENLLILATMLVFPSSRWGIRSGPTESAWSASRTEPVPVSARAGFVLLVPSTIRSSSVTRSL